MLVYDKINVLALTYSSESGVMAQNEVATLRIDEMRYLKRVGGKTRKDRIWNQTFRLRRSETTERNCELQPAQAVQTHDKDGE